MAAVPVPMTPDGEPNPPIERWAAGGLLWRREAGAVEVLIVHRPHRQDWSFAKGGIEPGETELEAACREVLEETGYAADVGPDLGLVHYLDHRGRSKQVRWWAMTVRSGEATVNDEVDELIWLPLEAAHQRLSYDTDRDVLRRFESLADLPGANRAQ